MENANFNMAAGGHLGFQVDAIKIKGGIHHNRIQHPQIRVKHHFSAWYSKMPTTSFSRAFFQNRDQTTMYIHHIHMKHFKRNGIRQKPVK